MVAETREVQHRKAGEMPDSHTYSLRETAAIFGSSYSGFREAMLRGKLPVSALRVGGVWRFPKAAVHKTLGIEESAGDASV